MLLALLAVVVVSIGVVVLMASLVDIRPNTLPFEIAKALLQVGLVSAAGATLSLQRQIGRAGRTALIMCRCMSESGVAPLEVPLSYYHRP